jgi:hypothetical protein
MLAFADEFDRWVVTLLCMKIVSTSIELTVGEIIFF